MKLAHESGINLEIKPVLPMVMRGVPATRQKGIYIFKDAAREARAQGVIYGKFYDPIGDPVLKGYALYVWAKTTGKGNDLLGSFLNAAFAEGINTNNYHGLRHVVEKAGLDWQEARNHLNDTEWHSELEQNRLSMYGFGSWGVPSYHLLDANGDSVLAVWGQDRLWLVSRKITDLITNKAER
jgi:2-hydroxychromene-2-carboxylate isomerase